MKNIIYNQPITTLNTKKNRNKKSGLSYNSYNLPSFLVACGFFRHKRFKQDKIYNPIRSEEITLNNASCDLKIEMPIFSYFLTLHQNLTIKNDEVEEIKVSYAKNTHFLKFLKLRQKHTIETIEEHIKNFVDTLKDEEIIYKNKHFKMFEDLLWLKDKQQILFNFSNDFIDILNSMKNPLTYISISEFKEVKSNKTSAVLYLLAKSISCLKSKKYYTRSYIKKILGLKVDEGNFIIDSAFKTLNSERETQKPKKKLFTIVKEKTEAFIKKAYKKVEFVIYKFIFNEKERIENDFYLGDNWFNERLKDINI